MADHLRVALINYAYLVIEVKQGLVEKQSLESQVHLKVSDKWRKMEAL